MYLGQRIKELRIKKGLTQLELANLLFVNDRTISKWEQERGNPDINIIPSLAEVLGVSIDFLMTGKEYVPSEDENKIKAIEYFESLIGQEITNDYTRRMILRQVEEHELESVKNALDTCYEVYLSKLQKPYETEAIREAVGKIGGILHNQSLSPLDKKNKHLISFLSKNTRNCSSDLKKRCEKSIRDFLSMFDKSNTVEQKLKIIDKLHEQCVNKHLDLIDVIRFAEGTIKEENEKLVLKNRIQNGYLKQIAGAPDEINKTIASINENLKIKNINGLSTSILNSLDSVFRYIVLSTDKELTESNVPYITNYYENLYIILGSFLGKQNFETVKYYISKYSSDNMLKIELNDLEVLHSFIVKMLNKIKKHSRSLKNNYRNIFSYGYNQK